MKMTHHLSASSVTGTVLAVLTWLLIAVAIFVYACSQLTHIIDLD